ncbi:hypothetical protein LJR066_002706 [Acidovorax sp. LjRoot66]|uniref:hypothetical protein n=1 Tax=Acidovorax sp. LjRoot66 TaxID=3342334 RepID=UPI003ECEAB37
MSDFIAVREGTWMYDGHIPTGVRIVSCSIRYGSSDWQDPPDQHEDQSVPGFDVQWALPSKPHDYGNYASAVFPTLSDAVTHVERALWAAATLKWADK